MFRTLEMIKSQFKDRTYTHFLTLKPPRGTDRVEQIERFCEYLSKRNIKYWIVSCKSETDYIHYHGIVSYPDADLPVQMESNKMAFQRKVNRDIGFSFPLQQVKSIRSIYEYIHQPKNSPSHEYHS